MNNRKQKIPKALREQVWITNFGKIFERRCYIKWCTNKINVFDYHVAHNIPESKGGRLFRKFKTCLRKMYLSWGHNIL